MDVREKLVELIKQGIHKGLIAKGDDRLDYSFEDVADYLISSGVTVQEWISVKDRLPEDQEEVLVCTHSKNGVRNIDKGYRATDCFIHRGRAEVTHWMPLPQPPKGEDYEQQY